MSISVDATQQTGAEAMETEREQGRHETGQGEPSRDESSRDEAVVRIVGLRKSFGGLEVLKGVDLEVERGQVVCILGRSGSGKSTLLRCINHLERPDSGAVVVDGFVMGYRCKGDTLHELRPSEAARQRQAVGMVFQSFNLFPHLTVMENLVEAPRKVQGRRRAELVVEAQALLKDVGLEAKADAYPGTLSGGQQQRVAIARALMMQPTVMLFDEPTSALDPELVGEVLEAMKRLAATGMTMIVVTHEVAFARNVADRVVFMADGVVVEDGPPSQVIDAPRAPETQTFLATML
ncbi:MULTISPECIES: amino acid ABC transporter ATP-binding protein [unclassified Aeromicrobium]|uniref:amino acid ABC transporter ATP-binding protein n=1 Tax=unclassified Aeromicrobium TaxID=2633570 RepID=UPI0028606575|nr:amino acid ABC transporter ATP-binding protein [Aeromicrobium sp. SORGH_AS_0981]MDR6117310.1 polar amino acid transport system ATP-binding protein [Aeromicrobium sp. SORGH_AS_0981]